jgi:ketosteroid isomerase-like protein
MKRVFSTLTMMMVVAVMPVALGQAGRERANRTGKAEREVLKQLDNWLDALRRSDLAALDRIMADDFMLAAEDGSVLSKEQDTAPIKSGDLRFESLTTRDVKVFVYGNTAVVTGVGIYKINFKGKASTIRERFFDVYQKRKGQWQVIASRPTPGGKEQAD